MPHPRTDRLHTAFTGVFESIARASPAGHVVHHGGITGVTTGIPHPYLNTLFAADATASRSDFSAAATALEDMGLPYSIRLRSGLDDRFTVALTELGLAENSAAVERGMYLAAGTEHTYPPELEIRVGRDALLDHAAISAPGFGTPVDIVRRVLTHDLLDSEEIALYTGYVDGTAVSSSFGYIVDSIINIFNVVTVSGHRRRGYGAAMTMRAAIDGFKAGCDFAFLEATSMGFPVYRRLGFEAIFDYRLWTRNAR